MNDRPTPPSDRSRVRRIHRLAEYDKDAIKRMLDGGFMAHLGYLHGRRANRHPSALLERGRLRLLAWLNRQQAHEEHGGCRCVYDGHAS